METRSKTLCKKRDLRGSSSASSSNRLRKKRFTAVKSTPKKDLHMVNWVVYDESFLNILQRVRAGLEVSMGCSYDKDFWQQVAAKLSQIHSRCFTLEICLKRIKQHKSIYRDYQHRMDMVQHSEMGSARYRELLTALFKQERPIKIPQMKSPCSGRGTSSVSDSRVRAIDGASSSSMVYPGELATVLTDLHSFHGLTSDKIMKIASFFSQPSNSLLVEIFLSTVLPEKKIEFIDDIINHHHL